MIVGGAALFVALGGSAVAADRLIGTTDIAPSAVTSSKIKNGTVGLADMRRTTVASLRGRNGLRGSTGAAGTNGLGGTNGSNGAAGPIGISGTHGTDGSDGADGVLGPRAATGGPVPLLTSTPPTTVVSLTVPAGNYVVLAKTQVSHTGAGDTVDCVLKAGTTTIDQASMKTLPALAAIPMSLQAVTTASPTDFTLECDVLTAGGSANHSSLIALPVA